MKRESKQGKPGPKLEVLKIQGDWRGAMNKDVRKEAPKERMAYYWKRKVRQ